VEFVVQLVYLFPRHGQGFLAGSGDPVDASTASADILIFGLQQSVPLQTVQQRVERPRAYAVAVASQLFHHGHTEDRLMRGMGQHVDANQAEK
jgi:hypothetical protein